MEGGSHFERFERIARSLPPLWRTGVTVEWFGLLLVELLDKPALVQFFHET